VQWLLDHATLDGPPVSDSRHTWTGPRRHAPADFVSPDGQHPALACKQEDALLDAWIFSGGNGVVDCVWVAGEKVVTAGRHRRHEESGRRFFRAMRQLCD